MKEKLSGLFKMNGDTVNKRVALSFLITGVFFVVFSLIALFSAAKAEYKSTTATIKDIVVSYDAVNETNEYSVLVDYNANGRHYRNIELGSYSSSMKIGDTVEVFYDTENPELIHTKGGEKVPFVTLAAGLAAGAYGGYTLLKIKKEGAADA